MEKLSQQKQTKESCEPAVRLVYGEKLTPRETARKLSTSDQGQPGLDDTSTPVTDLMAEVSRLRRELAEVRMECVILKQTVAYFAKAQFPGKEGQKE